MKEKTSIYEKLRYELENSVDINISTINSLYEVVDVLIDVIQDLQKDVKNIKELISIDVIKAEKLIEKVNSIPNKEIYV